MTEEQLKELLLSKLGALEKLTEERFDSNKVALKIQAAEYERRLDFLNGEAERLRQMQSTYLPREVYEVKVDDLMNKINNNSKILSQSAGRTEGISIAQATIFAIILFLISVASLIIAFLK